MKKRSLVAVYLFLLVFLFGFTGAYAGEMHLTSDRMQYDPEKGTVYAEGNVTLTRDGMTITAGRGEGNLDGTSVLFWENVKGKGAWSGEEVYFTCDMAEAIYGSGTFYALKGKVNSTFGQRTIIAETVEMADDKFSALSVDKFVDLSQGIEISCKRMNGIYQDMEIVETVAEGDVRVTLTHEDGKKTSVYGRKAVYSKNRGSVVVTGDARAFQEGRSIKAQSIVLFPETNRIEAVGRSTLVIEPEKGKDN